MTSDHIQIKIKLPNPNHEPPVSSKAPSEDLEDMDVLCTFKIKVGSQDSEHVWIKDQWPFQSHNEDAKLQSGPSSTIQSSKSGIKGNGCSLHLQNQDREPKFGTYVSKTSDHNQMKIKMLNPSEESPATIKVLNEALKDMDILCTFKFKIES